MNLRPIGKVLSDGKYEKRTYQDVNNSTRDVFNLVYPLPSTSVFYETSDVLESSSVIRTTSYP